MTFIAVFSFVFLFAWYAIPYSIKKSNQYSLRKLCGSRRVIALTYDDGPSFDVSKKLVDLLEKYDAKATFFVLGHKLLSATKVVDIITSGGHEIGSHSFRHLNAWKKSPLAVYRDIKEGFISTSSVATNNLFRPPHGKATLATMLQVIASGYRHAWWTIDSSDTWSDPVPMQSVIERIRREGGGVILMHDHARSAGSKSEDYVLDLTKLILDLARDEGFSICRLGEILAEYE